MGIQIVEENNLVTLNRAVIRVEQRISPVSRFNREES
jgi:hypothetical protein